MLMRASWIFTRADVIANIGVIVAGILVLWTESRVPDLIIGCAIGLYVLREAFEILRESREELQATFKSALQAGLAKLDLVTREEFEVQRAVLLKTREKLDALETAVRELEGRGTAE